MKLIFWISLQTIFIAYYNICLTYYVTINGMIELACISKSNYAWVYLVSKSVVYWSYDNIDIIVWIDK